MTAERAQDGASPRPTMKDVAALAGVAIKTVSRVMNGEPSVAPELAARVNAAADKLGYRPSLLASSLRRGDKRTSMVGMLVENISNPFWAGLLRAVEDETRRRGVQLLISSLDPDADHERDVVRTLIDRGVDGLVVVPVSDDQSYLVAERLRGTQVVFLDREPSHFSADMVSSDNFQGAREATAHLISHGHTRIGYLGDSPAIYTACERRAGYLEALREARIEVDPSLLIEGLRTIEAAHDGAVELITEHTSPPTAFFASQSLVTTGAIKALVHTGKSHQIALVGFDDFPLSDVLSPAVTLVAQDTAKLGRLATERLFERLAGDTSAPSKTLIKPTLIIRGSGEIRPTEAGH